MNRTVLEHTLPPPPKLVACRTILDVGAGIRPVQWYRAERHVCVDAHQEHVDILRESHWEAYCETALVALRTRTAEAVYMLDVIEHLPKEEGLECIKLLKRAATVQAVVYTPYGFLPQTGDPWGTGAAHWQEHRSGWMPEDFPGWRTYPYSPQGRPRPEGFYAIWTAR